MRGVQENSTEHQVMHFLRGCYLQNMQIQHSQSGKGRQSLQARLHMLPSVQAEPIAKLDPSQELVSSYQPGGNYGDS